MKKFVQTHRIDENRVRISTDNGLDIVLFANQDVPIDRASLRESVGIAQIHDTVELLRKADFLPESCSLKRVVLTPDFHKGSGIPVGTVLDARGFIIPKAIGRDINCSMRFVATDISADKFRSLGRELDDRLRHVFFAGGRDVVFDERQREAVMRYGILGLDNKTPMKGLFSVIDAEILECEFNRTHNGGSWNTQNNWMFDDFIRGSGGESRDSALGSIGGGNHFVEFQEVSKVMDTRTAYEWGIRPGTIGVMIHSGSLFAGGMVGDYYMDLARRLYPSNLERPKHDFYPLPLDGKYAHHAREYLNALGLASNFGVINRMCMQYMALRTLREITGQDFDSHLVYDLSHNMLFENGGDYIHRKGSSPSEKNDSFIEGHPVIIPGSMGSSSFIMKGGSLAEALNSAPHGAGRLLSRGKARGVTSTERLRVVSKVNPIGLREDIRRELDKELMEEAPDSYKPILPAFNTVQSSGMASAVAEMKPILTVKG